MKLYVARHTQTNYNVQNLCNADPAVDVHLTSLGVAQAQDLAGKLGGYSFDIIYISELPRTRETASYLAQYESTTLKTDKRLNENISGFEGQSSKDYVEAITTSRDQLHAKFNGGESIAEVNYRVADFLAELQSTNFQSVMILTHGFIVESIDALVMHRQFDITNTFNVAQGEYRLYELKPENL